MTFPLKSWVDGVGPTPLTSASINDVETRLGAWAEAKANEAVTAATAASIPLAQKGAASGVAELDGAALLPVSRLPTTAITTASNQIIPLWVAKTAYPTIGEQVSFAHVAWRIIKAVPNTINSFAEMEAGGYVARFGDATKVEIAETKLSPANVIIANAYTLVLSDLAKTVEYEESVLGKITVPENIFPVGGIIVLCQTGTAKLELLPAGTVKLRIPAGLEPKTNEQWSTISIRQRVANDWVVAGDLA